MCGDIFLFFCYILDELFRLLEPPRQLAFHSFADKLQLKYCDTALLFVSSSSDWFTGRSQACKGKIKLLKEEIGHVRRKKVDFCGYGFI